jgi:hypothetical protein
MDPDEIEQPPVVKDEVKEAAVDPRQAEVDALKAERDSLKALASEKEQAAQYWHEQAKGGKAPAKKDESEEDKTDFLELAAKGPKAVKAWMEKEGFVAASEVDSRVNAKATQLAREASLTRDYPELADAKSPFFQETAKNYQALLKQGVEAGLAMEMAAEKAELAALRSGKPSRTQEREARARAAGGDSGKRPAAQEKRDDGVEIAVSDDQIEKMCESFGITKEAYLKRANDGVRMARK